jgi:hypothetical protein
VFGGRSFGGLFAGLVQALPGVLNVFLGRETRDIGLNWINFTGQRLPDGDVIALYEYDLGDPNVIEIELHQPYNTWWKGIELFIGDSFVEGAYVQDSRRDSQTMRHEIAQLEGAGNLKFLKAKFAGVHTGMYSIFNIQEKRGKRLAFYWLDD